MHKAIKLQSVTQDKFMQITSPVITTSPLSRPKPEICELQIHMLQNSP